MEATTSLETAHPTKVTRQVEKAEVRATRKAKARTTACSQLKAKLGVESNGKKIDGGNRQILSGRNLSGNQIQKFGILRQTVPSLRCLAY